MLQKRIASVLALVGMFAVVALLSSCDKSDEPMAPVVEKQAEMRASSVTRGQVYDHFMYTPCNLVGDIQSHGRYSVAISISSYTRDLAYEIRELDDRGIQLNAHAGVVSRNGMAETFQAISGTAKVRVSIVTPSFSAGGMAISSY